MSWFLFFPATSALLRLPGVFQCAFWNEYISTVSQDHEVRKRSAISFWLPLHLCTGTAHCEPCLNRCDTDWAWNGSADDEERRVLSVPLRAPVCIWGPGLSSTYSCFFCSVIWGPHPWLPRLRTSWWLYCNASGKKVLRECNKDHAEPFEISTSRKQPIRNNCNFHFIFFNVLDETLVWKSCAFPSSFRMSRIQLLCQICLQLSPPCVALGTAALTKAVTTMPKITTKR